MGLYIKDVKKPQKCSECPRLWSFQNGRYKCSENNRELYFRYGDNAPEDCPLIEMNLEHDPDLIEFVERFSAWCMTKQAVMQVLDALGMEIPNEVIKCKVRPIVDEEDVRMERFENGLA